MHPKLLFFVDFLISLHRMSEWPHSLLLDASSVSCFDSPVLGGTNGPNGMCVAPAHLKCDAEFFPITIFPIFNLLLRPTDRRPFTSVLCLANVTSIMRHHRIRRWHGWPFGASVRVHAMAIVFHFEKVIYYVIFFLVCSSVHSSFHDFASR